jgi:adenylate kinase family enzyme
MRLDRSIGTRIQVMGNSSSGKSTFGAQLADLLGAPFVELDALNWEPGWVSLGVEDPDELERRINAATAGDAWVVAGSYASVSQDTFWDRLDTVIYLDLGIPRLLARMFVRSWRRWRSGELLWGTNRERFWPQLMVWRKDRSLAWWIVCQQRRKRQALATWMRDPRWSHIRFVELTSPAEIADFLRRQP